MSLSLALQMIETIAVVAGVAFGLYQLRQLRIQREVQGGLELLRSMQSPQVAHASIIVSELPDNLTRQELVDELGDDFEAVTNLMAVFESLGPIIARGHVPIDLFSDFYRGATVFELEQTQTLRRMEQRAAGWDQLSGMVPVDCRAHGRTHAHWR